MYVNNYVCTLRTKYTVTYVCMYVCIDTKYTEFKNIIMYIYVYMYI